jgi:hypothetical protein
MRFSDIKLNQWEYPAVYTIPAVQCIYEKYQFSLSPRLALLLCNFLSVITSFEYTERILVLPEKV